jgi:hypothetical protein
VSDADRWELEHGAEVEGEARATRMVAARAVDEEDVRRSSELAHGCFEQRAFA